MQEGQRTIARLGAGLMTAMLVAASTGRATKPVVGSGKQIPMPNKTSRGKRRRAVRGRR